MMSVRKFPWHSWHPASKTTTAADNADEDSEPDTLGSCSGDPTSEASMAADDANENSEVDTSSPEQPPPLIQKESKKIDGFTYSKASKKVRTEALARILKVRTKWIDQYTSISKARGILQHFVWGT